MAIPADKLLGVGLYSPPEAARLLGVQPKLVTRWLFGDKGQDPAVDPHFGRMQDPTHRIVTFNDLIQLRAVRTARNASVSLERIRQAVEVAQKHYGVRDPLLLRHQLFLFDRDLWISLPGQRVVGVSGRSRHQEGMSPVLDPYKDEVVYDRDGKAECWIPMRRGKHHVLIHPKRRFGRPLIMPMAYRIDLITPSIIGEGSVAAAARAYEIPTAAMRLAAEFEKLHGSQLAA